MEESPHKCPVCNRSFNQRSNLKTHLLTHTDHKPYECSSCGKVFRRNCDLRRHALTHAVGDVPAEVLDVGEEERHLSGDEDDSILEVDSPDQSPARIRSPSPAVVIERPEYKIVPEPEEEVAVSLAKLEQPIIDDGKVIDNKQKAPEVTHCHHEGQSGSYTMRRVRVYEYEYASMKEYHRQFSMSQSQQHSSKQLHDNFLPMLHVRRDLHHKNPLAGPSSTMTSGVLEPGPSFLGSIPFRKRPIGPDGQPQFLGSLGRSIINPSHIGHSLGVARPISLLGAPDDMIINPSQPPIIPLDEPLALQVPLPVIVVPQPQQQALPPPAPPQRKTGFTIEDIMRL